MLGKLKLAVVTPSPPLVFNVLTVGLFLTLQVLCLAPLGSSPPMGNSGNQILLHVAPVTVSSPGVFQLGTSG